MADEKTGWRDIASAPRDGTEFLAFCVYRPDGRECRIHMMTGCFAPNGRFASWPGRWNYDPTHWQPLPDPPKE